MKSAQWDHYSVQGEPGTWTDHYDLAEAIGRAESLGLTEVTGTRYLENGGVDIRVVWTAGGGPSVGGAHVTSVRGAKEDARMTQVALERAAGVKLVRGWILDGAGPARFGYARVDPCKQTWLGRTLADVAAALGVVS